tara:strand:- start:107 stop:751 length:645 start_codon:yes stop_codon:yes gene_type:complete
MDTTTIVIDTLQSMDTIEIFQDSIHIHKIILDHTQVTGDSDTFGIVSVVSGAIAALAALIAIYLTTRSNKQERESKRPYFTIEAPGFKQIGENLRLQITFINSGNHLANKFKGQIRIFQEDLKNENKIDIDVVNDIPANSPTPYYNDDIGLGKNMPKHFIFCVISYFDPILRKEYSQNFYMKWDGVNDGLTQLDFTHVNTTQKEIIEKYIKNNA